MKESHFKRFFPWKPNYFILASIFILLILDLLNGWYLVSFWEHQNSTNLLIDQALKLNQLSAQEIGGKDTIEQMNLFVNNMFRLFLLIILINNLFFYVFYFFRKKWAQSYVSFYVLTAALFSIFFTLDSFKLNIWWGVMNIISGLIYLYLFLAIRYLPPLKSNQNRE